MKILVAEDDKAMQKIISLYLQKEGYEVQTADDGMEALNLMLAEVFDLAVIDWMMPKKDGIALCKEIRSYNLPTKIMLLTAKSQTDDEIEGLYAGADDYVKKPFEPRILLLRVKKLLGVDQIMSCRDIRLDLMTQKVTKNNIELNVSKKEYELLQYFLQNKGIILSRDMLLNRVWGMDYEGDDRTVDTHVKRLRSKIGDECITTHRGLGYCMGKEV